MTLFLEYCLSTWTWTLFTFGLAIFLWSTFHGKLVNTLRKFPYEKQLVGSEDGRASTCKSLSCVRCSNSVFSTKKLLNKWRKIEKIIRPNDDICRKVKNSLFRDKLKTKGLKNQEPTVFFLDDLPAKIWYTSQDYPKEVSILEKKSSIDSILSEFLQIYEDLSDGWVANQVATGGWYLFYLVNQGVMIEKNIKRCLKTMRLIEDLGSYMSECVFGNVMFSVLLPGTTISCHCGPTNVRIRCHVPLKIPDGYFIRVAGTEKSWQEYKTLIFDDSFYHEVYHLGDTDAEPRVVLMIDFWHPSVSFQVKQIIKALFSFE